MLGNTDIAVRIGAIQSLGLLARQWHLGVVVPLARQIEHELTAKLDTDVRLRFDLYNVDLAGRAQAFQKLVAGGVAVNEALITTGLLTDDD